MTAASRATKSKWSEVLGVFSMFWIVVTSGGVLFNSKAILNYVLIFDVVLVIFLWASIYRKIVRLHLSAVGYILLLILFILLSVIANADFSSLLTYARLTLMLMLAMGVALALDKEKICDVFVKTVVVIAAFSVVFFYTGLIEQYAGIFPVIEFNENNYVNAFVYLHFESVEPRNFGIYVEPGLYQIYLNTAVFLLLSTKREIPYRFFWIGILCGALYSTYSTTGFIMVCIIFSGYAFAKQSKKDKLIFNPIRFLLILTVVGSFINSEFFAENIEAKFLTSNQVSYVTRVNSSLIDFNIIIDSPFFGVGAGNYLAEIKEYNDSGLRIDAATNTFSQLAALMGLPFVLLILIASSRFIYFLRIEMLRKLIIGIMYIVFFSTQPFILQPLFYLVAFMSFNISRQLR